MTELVSSEISSWLHFADREVWIDNFESFIKDTAKEILAANMRWNFTHEFFDTESPNSKERLNNN